MPEPVDAESRIGTIIGAHYLLEAVLGTGGFGAVYHARHLELEHDVAVKLLHAGADASATKRLTREAKVLARLDHPNCVRLMDFGSHAGAVYLVMELVAGRPLAKALGEPWAPRRAVDTVLELLDGLVHAHALGLVHRDLKPHNVLLAAGPRGGATVKIIDFGIVAIAAGEQLGSFTEQLTATGRIVGTPRYMSPEQLRGAKVDARSDLYALGLILFEMLAGHPAFDAGNVRQLACMHMVAPTPLLPDDVPNELAQLVGELLAKQPEQRPASAEAVRERLRALRPGLVDTATTRSDVPIDDAGPLPSAASSVDPIAIGPPTRVGRFSLLRELGRGAMGVVYLGWDETLDRQVAVKLLHPSPGHFRAAERLVREAKGLARVTHPNVVDVYELGSHTGRMFVAMEYVRGRTLRAWQREHARSPTETLARLCEAGRGLAAVHAAGLVHRDFKPENVLVGEDERARVVDFGLVRAVSPAFEMVDRLAAGVGAIDAPAAPRVEGAKVDPLAAKLTRTGAILGTPAYMGIEQLAGDRVDARSDQFAFCVVAWEALHGQRPFVGRSLEDLAAKLAAGQVEPRPKGSTVPRMVDEVLVRGLRVMPASRWPSMDALLDALERAAGLRGARWTRGRIAAGAGGSLLLLLGAAWALASGPQAGAQPEPEDGSAAVAPMTDDRPELVRALDLARARLARARPEDPASIRDAIELGDRYRDAMPLEVRASLHAVAGATHERYALPRELGEVGALAWPPEGPVLAIAPREGGIALWDADARTLSRTLPYPEPLAALAFSRDGELFVARAGGRAILWHVSTGTELARVEQPGLRQAAFVGDTQQLVVVSDEGVSLWGLVRGKELVRTRMLVEDRDVVALASTAVRVLCASSQGRASTWTRASDEIVRVELQGFEARVDEMLVLAPDGARVAQAGPAGVELWDAVTGTRIATATAEHAEIGTLVFSPDSRMLAVGIRGRAPLVLDAATGEARATTIAAQVQTRALAFDSTGTRLFALGDDGRLELAALASGRVVDSIVGVAPGARALGVDADGSRLAVIGEDGAAWVWATSSVAVARTLPAGRGSAAGSEPRVPWLGGEAPLETDAEGHVIVRATRGGAPVASLTVEGPVTAAVLSKDASMIATASGAWPARVELWTRDGQRTRTLELDGELRALAFSPDGTKLACAGIGPRVELWSTAEGIAIGELRTDEPEIHALAFAPNAAMLAVGGRHVHLWQLEAGFELATVEAAHVAVTALGFSPDGRQLGIAYGDGTHELRSIDEAALLDALCRAGAEGVDASACEQVPVEGR